MKFFDLQVIDSVPCRTGRIPKSPPSLTLHADEGVEQTFRRPFPSNGDVNRDMDRVKASRPPHVAVCEWRSAVVHARVSKRCSDEQQGTNFGQTLKVQQLSAVF